MTHPPIPVTETISRKGQITIRKRLREWLGVKSGGFVALEVRGGRLYITRTKRTKEGNTC